MHKTKTIDQHFIPYSAGPVQLGELFPAMTRQHAGVNYFGRVINA
jgi:hypothetical protein